MRLQIEHSIGIHDKATARHCHPSHQQGTSQTRLLALSRQLRALASMARYSDTFAYDPRHTCVLLAHRFGNCDQNDADRQCASPL